MSVSLAWWEITALREPPLLFLALLVLTMMSTIQRKNVTHALPVNIAPLGQVCHLNVLRVNILVVEHQDVLSVKWELIAPMKPLLRSKKMRICAQLVSIA